MWSDNVRIGEYDNVEMGEWEKVRHFDENAE